MEELLAYLEQRAKAEGNDSWEGYALIIRHLDKAKRRVPTKYDLMNSTDSDIDALLVREIEELAALVSELLPGGLGELEDYMPTNTLQAR